MPTLVILYVCIILYLLHMYHLSLSSCTYVSVINARNLAFTSTYICALWTCTYHTDNTSLHFSCDAMGYFTPPVGWIIYTNRKGQELHGGCDREDNRLQEEGGDQHKGVCLPTMTCVNPIIPLPHSNDPPPSLQ